MSTTRPSPEGVHLALDAATLGASVAIARGPDVLARVALDRRAEHAARLVPAIADALARAGLTPAGLAGVVVGEGPGSFTGVRVAAATAKGLTRALSIPLWAVSSLAGAALAWDSASGSPSIRYALFDARADRVYGACYAVDESSVRALIAPHAGTVGELAGRDVPAGAVFLGDAAQRHRALLEAGGYTVAPRPSGPHPHDGSMAVGLLRYLRLSPDPAPVADPGTWEPAYLRDSVAVPA
jgi:tRNA threonylcarbamoyladenosine biosynthesis protein TsaB